MATSIEDALQLIYTHAKPKSLKIIPLEQSLGYVLAQDVIALHNLPPYDNSAMDGYAIKADDANKNLKVKHTIFAGDNSDVELEDGFAIKIMTGAKIPTGCDSVIPIELVQSVDDTIKIMDKVKKGSHIRLCAEDIKSGSTLLHRGERIFAHHITLLASQGISHIKVYKKPKVAIFASGNELKMHFESVKAHQFYNTNSPTFFSRALELGCEVDFIGTANDTLKDIQAHIKSSLDCDLVITSGGVSVGDADFTKEAFEAFGYEIFFDKIEIKPGKPTTFGRIKDTLILNLPGNPLAAALNFELFAQSIILALSGDESKYLNTIESKMMVDYPIRSGRRSIVPGFFDGREFMPHKNFSPGMVSPLAISNAFIIIEESCEILKKGCKVKIIPTRFSFTSKEYSDLLSRQE